jgi:hypothetical protein
MQKKTYCFAASKAVCPEHICMTHVLNAATAITRTYRSDSSNQCELPAQATGSGREADMRCLGAAAEAKILICISRIMLTGIGDM